MVFRTLAAATLFCVALGNDVETTHKAHSDVSDYKQYLNTYSQDNQRGDYQQYMKKYAGINDGGYEQYMRKYRRESDYQQYMKKYAGGNSGDYQQYLKKYAGEYMEKHSGRSQLNLAEASPQNKDMQVELPIAKRNLEKEATELQTLLTEATQRKSGADASSKHKEAILNLAEVPPHKEGIQQKLANEKKKLNEETMELKDDLASSEQKDASSKHKQAILNLAEVPPPAKNMQQELANEKKKLIEETMELKAEMSTQAEQMNGKQEDATAHGQKTSSKLAILNLAEAPQHKEGLKQKLANEEKKIDKETMQLKDFLAKGAQMTEMSSEVEETSDKQKDADAHGHKKKKDSLAVLARRVDPLGSLAGCGLVGFTCFILVFVLKRKVRSVNLPPHLLG